MSTIDPDEIDISNVVDFSKVQRGAARGLHPKQTLRADEELCKIDYGYKKSVESNLKHKIKNDLEDQSWDKERLELSEQLVEKLKQNYDKLKTLYDGLDARYEDVKKELNATTLENEQLRTALASRVPRVPRVSRVSHVLDVGSIPALNPETSANNDKTLLAVVGGAVGLAALWWVADTGRKAR